MIDTDKYERLTMNDMEHLELWEYSRKLFAEVKRLRGLLDEIADFALNEMESNKEHNHILMNNIMATALWRTNTWWGKKKTRMEMIE